jgi:Bacteriocin-protection, YdeI or OmpD-Associated/Domain of unknown function (DUF1905)
MVSKMATKRFTAELERVGKTSARFPVPFDLRKAFGRARPPVKVTIGGHTWRTTPGVYGGVGYIGLNRAVRAAAGVDAGDRVRVAMELDTEPRTVHLPEDLRSALEAEPGALASFEEFSFTHRREYAEWVTGAKRPETRTKRIAETVRRVQTGEAPP